MTAVECYNQEIKELFNQFQDGEISSNMFHVQRLAALTQAKEMEKQEIEESHKKGQHYADRFEVPHQIAAEEYYINI